MNVRRILNVRPIFAYVRPISVVRFIQKKAIPSDDKKGEEPRTKGYRF